ncbi:MAG: DUF2304 domain-containing protein [Lachnospiraceae bacterium]|nr:DUF2304 domain-containing protein [Lachnospiraceae bacterium]MBO5509879.1 DUF2304 domain-containing protein [Lachnospiraceae bacterium]
MTLKIQIIIGIILVSGLCYVVNLIRKNKVELKYALPWLGAGVAVLAIDCFPVLMNELADLVGIGSPVNMIFFVGFLFVLVIVFAMTVALSIASSSVKRLTQKIALIEKRVRDLEEVIAKNNEKNGYK